VRGSRRREWLTFFAMLQELGMAIGSNAAVSGDSGLLALLRCPICRATLQVSGDRAACLDHSFPVQGAIPRLLPPDLMAIHEGAESECVRARTYRSFGFEWKQFARQLPQYRENFHWYLEPLASAPLRGLRVLDAGCGMGRHTVHFLGEGAEVVALDASPAIEAAAANGRDANALFLQADVLRLPLADCSFDLVCCLGVLHHIEDTAGGLAELVRVLRPGGSLLVYLYHDPGETSRWRERLLGCVNAARRLTTRVPLQLLRAVTWLFSIIVFFVYLVPAKGLTRVGSLAEIVRGLPLGQYVDYPFRVFWNDQFDRFSAPLEKRFRRSEVEELLRAAGLVEVRVMGGYGWRAAGRRRA
jgi:SAM-dependent methyltransferase